MGNEKNYNILIINLLGKSLEDLLTQHNRKLTLKTGLMLATQMIARIEFIHSK